MLSFLNIEELRLKGYVWFVIVFFLNLFVCLVGHYNLSKNYKYPQFKEAVLHCFQRPSMFLFKYNLFDVQKYNYIFNS